MTATEVNAMFEVGDIWEYKLEGGKPKTIEILGIGPGRKYMEVLYGKRRPFHFGMPGEGTMITYSEPGYVQFWIFHTIAELRKISGAIAD